MIENEQMYRASACSLIAALLRAPPQQALLEQVSAMSPAKDNKEDILSRTMGELAEASKAQDIAALEEEFLNLFIGLGRGELVPYGSWYLTGYLMEQPLSDLRDDLAALGFERNPKVSEPEDHISAIFEVFSVMVADAFSLSDQQQFFETHMLPWIGKFFTDLGNAKSASFYKPVASFGAAYLELEKTYLSMSS
jgi:TorA maturation chaperone TorD